MSQRDLQSQDYTPIRDLQESRRYAIQSLSTIISIHQMGDGQNDDRWNEARAQLHHATVQYYLQMKSYLRDANVLYDEDESKVFEDKNGKEFRIYQLDDFILSYETEEEEDSDSSLGMYSDNTKEVTKSHQLPPHISKECIDYLNSKLVDLGFTQRPQKEQKAKEIKEPDEVQYTDEGNEDE